MDKVVGDLEDMIPSSAINKLWIGNKYLSFWEIQFPHCTKKHNITQLQEGKGPSSGFHTDLLWTKQNQLCLMSYRDQNCVCVAVMEEEFQSQTPRSSTSMNWSLVRIWETVSLLGTEPKHQSRTQEPAICIVSVGHTSAPPGSSAQAFILPHLLGY